MRGGISEHNRSLYAWFKSNPKNTMRMLYPQWRVGVPTVLLKQATVWHDLFVADAKKNPGDGLLYFHDFLLDVRELPRTKNDMLPRKIPAYALLFNYWYTYSAEKGGPLTVISGRILTSVLFANPRLAVPLYEFRRQIDLTAFTAFATKLFREQRITVVEFGQEKNACTAVEHWLWEAVLGFSFPRLAEGWQNRMLNLWAGYTPEAVRRFVTLHSSTRRELREYLIYAESLYNQTKSLIGCRSTALVGECRVPQMSSVGMMQRFHDAEHVEQLRQQMAQDESVYEWPGTLTKVLQGCPEWYIPIMGAEVLLRGAEHKHCVGSYKTRHFQPPQAGYKVLLLFSDMYTAEIFLHFRHDIVSRVSVIQVRGNYNAPAPAADMRRVQTIAKKMNTLPAEAFCPKRLQSIPDPNS